MMRRRSLLAAALFATAAMTASCTDSTEGKPLSPVSDKDLDAKIADLRASGKSAPLATLTSFGWQEVFCYYEGTSANEINAEVGPNVFEPGTYPMVSGAIAVFTKDGKVVKALVIPELNFKKGKQPAGVIVEKGFELVAPA
ncbi:hypothetical protein Rhe02_62970 [Rhizocola hellebori]|uniref:Uncharacterized protein n=1 Tax=Rhizocola hellebori TaxID=1392758 RepID=A0A8J3VJ34_9ACTN|nr:hypothetical protein [Rhizocola hellebori]GIH08230.1 hypothetical protein Rhe02_62970 [Rhizocola hellebori]